MVSQGSSGSFYSYQPKAESKTLKIVGETHPRLFGNSRGQIFESQTNFASNSINRQNRKEDFLLYLFPFVG